MDTEPVVTWPEEKRCGHCKHLKPAGEFGKDKNRSDGLHNWCKTCVNAAGRDYWARPDVQARRDKRRQTEEGRTARRRQGLKYHYKLTLEQYDDMLAAQGDGCAICARKPRKNTYLCVDHDHSCCPGRRSCGKCVRGLLCQSCNQKALGYWLHESTKGTDQALATARRLVAYLERSQDGRAERAA